VPVALVGVCSIPSRVESRGPAAVVVLRQLRSKPWRCMPTATWPMADQESSQVSWRTRRTTSSL